MTQDYSNTQFDEKLHGLDNRHSVKSLIQVCGFHRRIIDVCSLNMLGKIYDRKRVK